MKNYWWIPKQKHYQIETKEWWCTWCGAITPLERNKEWDGSFKGDPPAPTWFVRCGACHKEHWQSSCYDCPDCGYDPSWQELPPLRCTVPVPSRWAAMEFGGNPVDWEETHLCPYCNKEFTFTNSNY